VAEWLKAHAWKACIQQCIGGSNPFLSAKQNPAKVGFFIFKSTQVHLWGFKNKKNQAAQQHRDVVLSISPKGIIRLTDVLLTGNMIHRA
jgi:hypothetical protein